MASQSCTKASSTPSSNSTESYIGCSITLISNYEIRYEGVLYCLNVHDSTIGLKNVRSYGTEGRRKDGQQVPPSDKVYEYILFRGSDIKDLQIKSPSTSVRAEEQICSGPAIIQSQYSVVLSSPVAPFCGRSLTESTPRQDSPAKSSKAIPVGLPYHQSVTEFGPSNQSASIQAASHPSSTSMYWQGRSGTSSNSPVSLLHPSFIHPSSMVSPLVMQNHIQTSDIQEPTNVGHTTLSECSLPVSSTSASPLNLSWSPSPTSLKISDSLVTSSFLSIPDSGSMTTDTSNTPSYYLPLQEINSMEGRITGKTCDHPSLIYPRYSVRNPASSIADSTLGPLPKTQSLFTSDQFAHPREQLLKHDLNPNWKDMPLALTSSVPMPNPISQAQLLPLPTSVQKVQCSVSHFTEEFDFAAMNKKFKKDEIWSSLGKTTAKIEGIEDISFLNLGDREYHDLKPAYKKDDFFDTISCNSMTCGSRNGHNRSSTRIKQDTAERFDNFHQRPNIDYYGDYGTGRGVNFRGSYNLGRGYGYAGRGRGPNFPF